jgi:hypothetical protein
MLRYSHLIDFGRVSVMFSGKPPDAIRAMLKVSGFRWSHVGGFWWRKRVEGFADFLAALDRALQPGRPDGACWRCKAPAGFFRRFGASTPVYCEACYQAARNHQREHGTFPDRSDLDYEDRCRDACGL